MRYQRVILLLALCAAVAACDTRTFNFSNGKNGTVSSNGHLLKLSVEDQPSASIDPSGNLSIDDKAVSLAPQQQGLLMLYYQGIMDIRQQSVGMGQASAEMGVKAMQNSLSGKSDPDAKQKRDAEIGSMAHQLSLKTCQDEVNLKAIQDQLVARLPAFKTYGNIFGYKSVDECMKEDQN